MSDITIETASPVDIGVESASVVVDSGPVDGGAPDSTLGEVVRWVPGGTVDGGVVAGNHLTVEDGDYLDWETA